MSATYSGSLTGIHPFSEATIQKIFDFKYGRSDKSQAVAQIEKDYTNLITLEKEGKWKYISTGNIGWYDLLRPFSENLSGLASVSKTDDLPVTRNPLTNTFFRQAKITGPLEASETILTAAKHPFLENGVLQAKFLPPEGKGKTWTQILPGPYYFANMSDYTKEGRKTYPKNIDAAVAFARCLEKIIPNLAKIGFNAMILDESPIVWEERIGKPLNTNEISSAVTMLNDLQTKVKTPLIVHLFNGNALQIPKGSHKSILEHFLESKIAGISIDFISTPLSEVIKLNLQNKIIFAGLINAQGYSRRQDGSVVLESPTSLAQQLGMIAKAGAKEVILCPNSRLEFLPRSIADQKIEVINKTIGGI